jgi:hypothetical protein
MPALDIGTTSFTDKLLFVEEDFSTDVPIKEAMHFGILWSYTRFLPVTAEQIRCFKL